MNATQGDGKSLREHLLAVERVTGIKPKELDELVSLPEEFIFLWNDFVNLSSTRSGGFSISPISYLEIYAYSKLYGIKYDPWQLDIIRKFDSVAMQIYSEEQKKEANKKSNTK